MSLLISGSIAFDTIIQTLGDFRDADTLGHGPMHLSLFSPHIRREYGGTAANIAYNLALLGKKPHIIGSIGTDGIEYKTRLSELGIHTELIHMIPGSYCPQAYIVRDEHGGQINTFHPGAMSTSGEITHGSISFDHAIVAPDSREGMIRRVRECSEGGIYTIFDPGQAMGIFSKEELLEMVKTANLTIMNEPESRQFHQITGVDVMEYCPSHKHTAIITLGESGALVRSKFYDNTIHGISVEEVIDPTGCGDAFRA